MDKAAADVVLADWLPFNLAGKVDELGVMCNHAASLLGQQNKAE